GDGTLRQGRQPEVHPRMHPAADRQECGRHDRDRSVRVPAPRPSIAVPADRTGAGGNGRRSRGENLSALQGCDPGLNQHFIARRWRHAAVRGKYAAMNPLAAYRERFLDVLASIYIYNEHRGYTSLDRVLEAARLHCP